MFKPKNHFASHFPLDILTHGPVRHYWCMRFEALNQLFKSFASHGAFRDTCGRCAEFWSMHIARARSVAATSSMSTTVKVIRAKQPRKYEKGLLAMSDLSEDSGGVTVVEGILGILQKTSVRIEWISRLQYGSAEIFAGQTWLSATLNGDSILAFLPVSTGSSGSRIASSSSSGCFHLLHSIALGCLALPYQRALHLRKGW